MTIAEMRAALDAALLGDSATRTTPDKDRAFRFAATEMIRATRCTRSTATKVVTAFNPAVDFSTVTGFRVERAIKFEAGYNSLGTWNDGLGAVAVNDLVTGDGDPDARTYVCKAAHTAAADNEPGTSGGADYWLQIDWTRGTEIGFHSYENVRDYVNGLWAPPDQDRYEPWVEGAPLSGTPGVGAGGRPRVIGFLTATTAYIGPVPDLAYPINVTFWSPLTSWTAGATDGGTTATVLNIPDEYIEPVISYGAVAVLTRQSPDRLPQHPLWQMFLRSVAEITGQARVAPASSYRRPNSVFA